MLSNVQLKKVGWFKEKDKDIGEDTHGIIYF